MQMCPNLLTNLDGSWYFYTMPSIWEVETRLSFSNSCHFLCRKKFWKLCDRTWDPCKKNVFNQNKKVFLRIRITLIQETVKNSIFLAPWSENPVPLTTRPRRKWNTSKHNEIEFLGCVGSLADLKCLKIEHPAILRVKFWATFLNSWFLRHNAALCVVPSGLERVLEWKHKKNFSIHANSALRTKNTFSIWVSESRNQIYISHAMQEHILKL